MIVAIFGRSCTGKSSVTRLISGLCSWESRICGDIIRARAAELGVVPEDLSIDEHRRIDTETVAYATVANESCLVDGRYLNYVLHGCRSSVFLVEFVATQEVRLVRWQQRLGRPVSHEWLSRLDGIDIEFSQQTYADVVPISPQLVLDTADITIRECSELLLLHLRRAGVLSAQ